MFRSKAGSLIALRDAGFDVPFFVVLPQDECTPETIGRSLGDRFPKDGVFAVRSSSVGEDGSEKSFAGAFYSALGVAKDDVARECEKVIASYEGRGGEVIIQAFVPSTSAGVIFSDIGNGKAVINANFGLCESVVKGRPCDEYVIDRQTGEVASERIEDRKRALYFSDRGFKEKEEGGRSLSDKQIKKVAKAAAAIEKAFKVPQDIEFCFSGQKLFILQSRPITRPVSLGKRTAFYDSANIAESYSGIVLPLTLSFVKRIYSVVYKDLVHASGISRRKIEKYDDVFETLTASFYGRLFYNMNSWYEMMSFFPGYERNKGNLELMISSNARTEIARDIKPTVSFSIFYYVLVAVKLLLFPIAVFRFKRKVRSAMARYARIDMGSLDLRACGSLFQEFLSGPLRQWYIAVENDTALMTSLGKAHAGDARILDRMHITSHTVSADQVRELKRLADVLMEDDALAAAVRGKDRAAFEKRLSANSEARERYEKYFSVYGGRFANELKLESDDLREDFERFSSLVVMYAQTKPIAPALNKRSGRASAVALFIRYFATNREEMRLLRSNMFSMVRALFLRAGTILTEEGVLSNPKDIFYLSIDEVFASERERASVKDLIRERKDEYANYASLNIPSHFSLAEGELPEAGTEKIEKSAILFGSPSSPGLVSGRVRMFPDFYVPDVIDFDILVTSHTDPGWVPLIGLAKGLVIEHGGILSHASIVSRELGIPAIVGVKGAMELLKNGDYVELDAERGAVSIKSRN